MNQILNDVLKIVNIKYNIELINMQIPLEDLYIQKKLLILVLFFY